MTFRRDKEFCQAEDHANKASGNKCKFAWSEALTKLFIPEKSHDNKFIVYNLGNFPVMNDAHNVICKVPNKLFYLGLVHNGTNRPNI